MSHPQTDGEPKNLVLQRSDTERPQPPSGFGMYTLRDGLARYAPL